MTLSGRRILLLGRGAVRGVLEPLLAHRPAALVIANRTASRAEQLVQEFAELGPLSASGFAELAEPVDLIVNGTSASLGGELPPLADSLIVAGRTFCYDMMYSAEPTPFCRWAAALGATTRDGLGMLVEQAAEAFELWRGVRPDTAPVLAELRRNWAERALGRPNARWPLAGRRAQNIHKPRPDDQKGLATKMDALMQVLRALQLVHDTGRDALQLVKGIGFALAGGFGQRLDGQLVAGRGRIHQRPLERMRGQPLQGGLDLRLSLDGREVGDQQQPLDADTLKPEQQRFHRLVEIAPGGLAGDGIGAGQARRVVQTDHRIHTCHAFADAQRIERVARRSAGPAGQTAN